MWMPRYIGVKPWAVKTVNGPDRAYAIATLGQRVIYRRVMPTDLEALSKWHERWPDPAESARLIVAYVDIAPHHLIWCEGINEPVLDSEARAIWFGRVEAERSKILKARGCGTVIGSFATGNPDPDLFRIWLSSYLASGGDREAKIGLHMYGSFDLDPEADDANALGYRRLTRAAPVESAGFDFLATETGLDRIKVNGQWVGGGWARPGSGINEEMFLAWKRRQNRAFAMDGLVISDHPFTSADVSGWETFDMEGASVVQNGLLEDAAAAPVFTFGVDVSDHQKRNPKDWRAARASGVQFAIHRVANGLEADDLFGLEWPAIKAAGILRGPYHYFQNMSGEAQARFFLARLAGDWGELPAFLDLEVRIGNMADYLAQAKIWLEVVERETGRRPLIYTGPNAWETLYAKHAPWASAYELWISNPPLSEGAMPSVYDLGRLYNPDIPLPWVNARIWQFSWQANVPGVGAPVDMDVFYGSLDDLKIWAKVKEPDPVPVPVVKTWQAAVNAFYGAGKAMGYPVDKIWEWMLVRGGAVKADQAITDAWRRSPYSGPAPGDLNLSSRELAELLFRW